MADQGQMNPPQPPTRHPLEKDEAVIAFHQRQAGYFMDTIRGLYVNALIMTGSDSPMGPAARKFCCEQLMKIVEVLAPKEQS